MKRKPETPEEKFQAAKEIIASRDYKIFTPVWRYFRHQHQFIAATSYICKRLFLLQLRKGGVLTVRALPPSHGDRVILHAIESELRISISIEKPLFRLTTEDPWDAARLYVAPRERDEFDLFVKELPRTRLP